MRLPAALLVLAGLATPAAAQPPVSEWVSVEIEPFPALVKPLQGPVTAPFTARASCLLASGAPPQVVMSYTVAAQPDWTTVLVSPATDARPLEQCDSGYVSFEGTVTVTANDRAPAFAPAPIEIEARAEAQAGPQAGRGMVNVSASYFGILDTQLAQAQAVVPPGGSHEFVARFTNFGNGDTRVETALAQAPGTLQVGLPAPVTLESAQAGGERVSEEVRVRVVAPEESGFVNRVESFSLRITSAYDKDDSYAGDESSLSFLVTVRTGADEGPSDPLGRALPLGWALVPAALALATLLPSRRRRP